MNKDNCIRYTYGLKITDWLIFCSISLFCLYSLRKYLSPNLIEKLISLQINHLDYSFIFSTVASIAIAFISIYKLTILLLKGKNFICLTSDGIEIINQGLKQKSTQINYESICQLTLQKRKGKKFLSIKTNKKTFSFISQKFEDESDFGGFCFSISERSNINIEDKTKFFSFLKNKNNHT